LHKTMWCMMLNFFSHPTLRGLQFVRLLKSGLEKNSGEGWNFLHVRILKSKQIKGFQEEVESEQIKGLQEEVESEQIKGLWEVKSGKRNSKENIAHRVILQEPKIQSSFENCSSPIYFCSFSLRNILAWVNSRSTILTEMRKKQMGEERYSRHFYSYVIKPTKY